MNRNWPATKPDSQVRVAPRIVRIYTLRGFESVLAGSVQVSTGTKTSLSFQDGPVFTRVHRRVAPLLLGSPSQAKLEGLLEGLREAITGRAAAR